MTTIALQPFFANISYLSQNLCPYSQLIKTPTPQSATWPTEGVPKDMLNVIMNFISEPPTHLTLVPIYQMNQFLNFIIEFFLNISLPMPENPVYPPPPTLGSEVTLNS